MTALTITGCRVKAQDTPDMTVQMEAGAQSQQISFYHRPVPADTSITIAAADVMDRYDTIASNRADQTAVYLQGTPGNLFAPIDDSQDLDYVATVLVRAGSTSVLNSDITNLNADGVLEPVIYDATLFGAVADGLTASPTDSGPAIQAAVDAAKAAGGTVKLKAGVYMTNQQIHLYNRVKLIGDGERATGITAGASFPTSTAMIRLGDNTAIVYDCRLESLYLDCKNISGSIGVYTNEAEELTGVFNCLIVNYRGRGIHFDYTDASHNCQNCGAAHLELQPSTSGSTAGVDMIVAGHGFLDDISIVSSGGTHADGIIINNSNGCQISNIQIAGHTDGVDARGTGNYFLHDIVGGPGSATNLIHLGAHAEDCVIVNATRGGFTNVLVDDTSGITWTDTTLRVFTGKEMWLGQCRILTGTGSPESVVTARVGSLFLRADGGAGTTLYVKQSGTGNTGWVGK